MSNTSIAIAEIPDVENILASDLKTFFDSEMKFQSLFPKEVLKVTTDHPFVQLMNQEVPDGGKYNLSCLPAVAIMDMNFTKLIETPVTPNAMKVMPAIIDEIKQYGRDQFTMSKQGLAALEEKFKTSTELKAEGYETWRKTSIAIEIWAANNLVKGKIFDLISLYLIGKHRLDLRTNHGVMIEEETVNGEKSGIYNFDFGEVLYGAMLRFTVGYKVGFYMVEDFVIGASVSIINDSLI